MQETSNILPVPQRFLYGKIIADFYKNVKRFFAFLVRLIANLIQGLLLMLSDSVYAIRSSNATACTAIPCPAPVNPSFSSVVALTLTAETGTPQQSAMFSRICKI